VRAVGRWRSSGEEAREGEVEERAREGGKVRG